MEQIKLKAKNLLNETIKSLESCDKEYLNVTRNDLSNFLEAYFKADLIDSGLYKYYTDLATTIFYNRINKI